MVSHAMTRSATEKNKVWKQGRGGVGWIKFEIGPGKDS